MTTLEERNNFHKHLFNAKTLFLDESGYKLKSGDVSPFYINMKSCMSSVENRDNIFSFIKKKYDLYVKKLKRTAEKDNTLEEFEDLFDIKGIIGVPYGGIQYAIRLGEQLGLPNLILRDKLKEHGLGTKKPKYVEGIYNVGDNVIVVEDVVSTGASCLEGIKHIEQSGLSVSLVVVIMDRDQGGVDLIESEGYNVLTITNVNSYLETLVNNKLVEQYQYEAVIHFTNLMKTRYSKEVAKHLDPEVVEEINKSIDDGYLYEPTQEEIDAEQEALRELEAKKNEGNVDGDDSANGDNCDDVKKESTVKKEESKPKHIYSDIFQHKLRCSILELMKVKKSCLCLSLDVNKWETGKKIIEECGEHIIMVKTHVETYSDFNNETFANEIKELANKYNFFVMEDRKLADVDEINWKEMMFGIFRIDDWASFITLHGLTAESTLNYYIQRMSSGYPLNIAPCVVAQMNSMNSLIDSEYTKKTIDMLDRFDKDVGGSLLSPILITQCLPSVKNRLKFTPGVCLEDADENSSQLDTMNKYRSVETAILYEKNHGVIVGKDIVYSKKPGERAKKYAELSWEYFQQTHPELVKELDMFIEELGELNAKLMDSLKVDGGVGGDVDGGDDGDMTTSK